MKLLNKKNHVKNDSDLFLCNMDNSTFVSYFETLSQLMDIHGENSFAAKSYAFAAITIDKLTFPLHAMSSDQIKTIKGIGNSIALKIIELKETGNLKLIQEIQAKTPQSVIEMLLIKGIGPKKINVIWKEMNIQSIDELLTACNENRIQFAKGFGLKMQEKIKDAILFYYENKSKFLYAQAEDLFPQIDSYLKKIFGNDMVQVTGNYRRKSIIIEEMEFIISTNKQKIKEKLITAHPPKLITETEKFLLYELNNGLKLKIYYGEVDIVKKLFETTGSHDFISNFIQKYPSFYNDIYLNENEIFAKNELSFIQPILRENGAVITQIKEGGLPQYIEPENIKGIIHCHSNWSDGSNTIEEMALACIQKKMEYLVISDHSQSATYANGLSPERIKEQHKLIDALNYNLKPFKIFKSIECDILNNGDLDYSNEILSSFDLTIVSIHSNLTMNEDKAMERLLRAIENPYTRIVGHMTGRLLLSRKGYPVNYAQVIDTCAKNNVAIEINANPRRLDIDWNWIPYCMKKQVWLSINPDAHSIEGFEDIKYGVYAAQKGQLRNEHNISSLNLQQFENWLALKK